VEDEVRRAGLGPEVIGRLARSLERVEAIVTALQPGAWAAPSPCEGWDIRDVVDHLASVTTKFTRFALGEDGLLRQAQGDLLGPDRAGSFAAIVNQSSTAWRDNPGALTRICHLPFGRFDGATAAGINLFDAVVHGWDVATAVGTGWPIEDDAVLDALEVCDVIDRSEARDIRQFGPPRSEGESAMERLLARTGRG
jgi:uncharacterized protein (TIGR03086 family)